MYDVIIIGVGPAGCTAAKILSEKGYTVLVAERFKLPRYKSCSGVLIKKSMDLVRMYFEEDVPAEVTCEPAENRGMIFTDDKGKEFPFVQEGRNVWRSSFDNWLAEKASQKGAEIRDCTSAIQCEEQEGYVSVTLQSSDSPKRRYTEEARFVLDCEGVTGTVKRKLAKKIPQNTLIPPYITTFQTFNLGVIDLDYHYFYAYLQPELSEYDAWFNVKDNLLVLGVAVRDTDKIGYFYDRFLAYMKEKHNLKIEKQVKAERWLMPQIRPGCRIDYGVGRVLFAGETAGFLNPMGEGISAGMESGYAAACAIAEYDQDLVKVYASYREGTEKLRNYMERQWNFVGCMVLNV